MYIFTELFLCQPFRIKRPFLYFHLLCFLKIIVFSEGSLEDSIEMFLIKLLIKSNLLKREEQKCASIIRFPCQVSHVTCHLTTTLCSFSCSESPRRFGDAAEGGLVIVRVKIPFHAHFCSLYYFSVLSQAI